MSGVVGLAWVLRAGQSAAQVHQRQAAEAAAAAAQAPSGLPPPPAEAKPAGTTGEGQATSGSG